MRDTRLKTSRTSARNIRCACSFVLLREKYTCIGRNRIGFHAKTAERNADVRARECVRRNECIFQEECCIRLLADRKVKEAGRRKLQLSGTLLAGTSILMGMGFSAFGRHMLPR